MREKLAFVWENNMTQTYNVAIWNGTHQNAEPVWQQAFPLTASFDDSFTLAQGVEAAVELAAANGWKSIISVGAVYGATQRHNAKDWRSSNALILEWRAHQAEDVVAKLEQMKLHHIIFNTLNAQGEKCITAVLPMSEEVDDKSDYARLASLIASDIKFSLMSDGFHSCTFLVRPDTTGVIYECEGDLIDPSEELPRRDFVSAKDFVGAGL